jgi:AraC family transcriptional regulator
MEWLTQLSHAIDYIEKNLAGEISYDKAAKAAGTSRYDFQRVFSYIAGIPLSEYIRCRRMTAAAFELQSGVTKVMDVGLKYGYDSPTAFNRAFQNFHGVAPNLARLEGTTLNAYPRIRLSVHITRGESMKYRIETKESMRIVGVKTALTENQEENFKIVPEFWESSIKSQKVAAINRLNNRNPHGILGVTVCQNPEQIEYYIAVATDQPGSGELCEFEIPSATWSIFECDGAYPDSIQNVFKQFLMEWLPFSGYDYAQLPDIEVYPNSDRALQSGNTEVWIAVKKSKLQIHGEGEKV